MDEHIKQIVEAGKVMALGFRRAAAIASVVMREWGDAFYQLAEQQYRLEHKRLPGSLRTKRLRRKRRVKVLDWFYDEYLKRSAL